MTATPSVNLKVDSGIALTRVLPHTRTGILEKLGISYDM